jgi:hypothetical protein
VIWLESIVALADDVEENGVDSKLPYCGSRIVSHSAKSVHSAADGGVNLQAAGGSWSSLPVHAQQAPPFGVSHHPHIPYIPNTIR